MRLQDFEDVDKEDEQQLAACLDRDEVMKLLACYAFFICLANRHWGTSRFDELFTHLWWVYWDNFKCEMGHFWDEAQYWKGSFEGCLFFER